jgi:outer membrane protein assembly factor BamB
MNPRTLLPLTACLLAALPARAADWPQWRGPDRTDVSKETGLLKSWPKEGPKLLWTYKDAGNGYSGPAIVGDRLYTLGARGDTEYVIALDLKGVKDGTVKEAWSAKVGPRFNESRGDGPRSTPTVDGDVLYALSPSGPKGDSQGELVCVELAGGKIKWQKSLRKDLGGKMMSGWGYSESPLVDGEQLICTPGGKQGTLAALNKKTGDVIWRSKELTDDAGYSSVVAADLGGVRQYVQTTKEAVAGVAAKDGKLLWRFPKPEYRTAVIPTPIVRDNLVYVTAGYGVGCDLLQINPEGQGFKAERLYDRDARKLTENKHGGVVLVGDHIYGWSDSGNRWVCQELKTGKQAWESKALGRGSITCADGCLYCYSEDNGTCVLIEATPTAWKETGRFTIPQQKKPGSIWPHPVVANGRLYLRDQDLIFCYDVKDHGAADR